MLIRFVHHSCFLIEIDDRVLIFDYFNGNRVNGFEFHGEIPEYDRNTSIYVFASHSHQDHYDMDVLRWSDKYPNIKFVFSKDIRISPNFLKKHDIDPDVRKRVLFVAPNENYELDQMKISTFRSTDAGVAFLVNVHGATFFHAGDLNYWRMEGAGELINGMMRNNYRTQIHKVAKTPVNVAFLPLDPRLGQYAGDGFRFFLENVECDYVFPMHCWQDYGIITSFKKRISNQMMCDKIIMISHENQEFEING